MENATAPVGGRRFNGGGPGGGAGQASRANGASGVAGQPPAGGPPAGSPPNGAPNPNGGRPGQTPAMRQQLALASRRLQFCLDEGAILLVDPGTRGDGGTLFVQQATVPQPTPPTPPNPPPTGDSTPPTQPGTTPAQPGAAGTSPTARGTGTRRRATAVTRVSPWDKDAPRTVPQIVVAGEQYNRMVRMIQQGEKLKMAVDLDVKFL